VKKIQSLQSVYYRVLHNYYGDGNIEMIRNQMILTINEVKIKRAICKSIPKDGFNYYVSLKICLF